MLKITLHDRPESLRFQLEGRLIGAWVRELEQCWTTAASVRGDRKAVFDLTDVTFIDDSGKELLGRLAQDGAEFAADDLHHEVGSTDVVSSRGSMGRRRDEATDKSQKNEKDPDKAQPARYPTCRWAHSIPATRSLFTEY